MCSRKGVSGKRQSEDKRLKCPMSKTKSPINRGRELRPHSRWDVRTKVARDVTYVSIKANNLVHHCWTVSLRCQIFMSKISGRFF